MPAEGAHSEDPGLSGDYRISRTLCGSATSEIRRLLRDLLSGHGGLVVDDAILVADELVSNALQHGAAPRSCRLILTHDGARVRIEVDDSSPRDPRLRPPDHTGGRGLILVDRLASRWGFDRHDSHKTVWAELTLNAPGSSGHAPHLTTVPDWGT